MPLNDIDVDLLLRLSAYTSVGIISHWPGNWIVRALLKPWKQLEDKPSDRMGAFLGTLERTLILILIGLQAYTAVGFVVTMKSIARFDKLKERTFAEYFLAGTMLSMLLALILGLVIQFLIGDLANRP